MAGLESQDVDDLVAKVIDVLINLEDKTGEWKYQIADGRIIDSTSWNFWEWPQAIGLNGLFEYYLLKCSSSGPDAPSAIRTISILKDWYAARAAEGTTTKNINSMSVLYSVASLLELERDRGGVFSSGEKERYSGWADEWAEWVMTSLPRTEQGGFQHITFRQENKNQLWDDTLMMTVMPLAKIGKLLNRPAYVEEAKFQFLIHIQYLMDTSTGLWFHGYQFDAKKGHNFAKGLWGRGNCWITLAIPMFLNLVQLPPADPVYRALTSALTRQVDALVELQDLETGLWHTLLDDPTSYPETSCAAGFVGGMLMAIRLGYLPKDKYLPTACSGLKACIAQIKPDGSVANVSKGTPMGHTLQFYKDIPLQTAPYGQSLVIVALVEWLRLDREH